MDLCTKLSDRVLDLEITKIAQAKEITSLKKIVKKLERKRKSKTLGMKRSFKIGRSAQVVSSEDEGLGDQEDASKQRRKIVTFDSKMSCTGYLPKDKNKATNDKTKHGMEKRERTKLNQSQSPRRSQSQPRDTALERASKTEPELMGLVRRQSVGYKQSQLKNKSFAEIQKLFDKAMTRVNMFVDMDTELVKESSKKAEAEMA
ncbi:hypothetical protein Tco_0317529 [Tanacetum coccineum]